MTDFYTAQEARDLSITKRTVLDEVQMIQTRIMDAVAASSLSVLVGPGSTTPVTTGFTVDAEAFDAWYDPANHNGGVYDVKTAQMNDVVSTFTKLGYTITRSVENIGNKTFNWNLSW